MATRSAWFDRTVAVGGSIVRVDIHWVTVAPRNRPRDFDPSNPADPAYDWARVDDAVRDASARGLEVLLTFRSAPQWAEGSGRDKEAPSGTWRPDVRELRGFAGAAAYRYSGSFPDPMQPGAPLPWVRNWQAWNEPNLSTYLTPQWTREGNRYEPASPKHYRAMLNTVYRAVKAVRRDNSVVSAGTSPYGDPLPGGRRMPPVMFTRELFCLRDQKLRKMPCPSPPHLDILDHHPYGVGSPQRKALNVDDAAIPDLGKLTRVLRAAERSGRALPRGNKRLWVTEFSWDSSPPDPNGVPAKLLTKWIQDSYYAFWRQGVDTAIWYQIRDSSPKPSYNSTYQSGVFMRSGEPKPTQNAFRFPFVTRRVNRKKVRVWGKAPSEGEITIERRVSGEWISVGRAATTSDQVFLASVRLRGAAALRARTAAGEVSLPSRQR